LCRSLDSPAFFGSRAPLREDDPRPVHRVLGLARPFFFAARSAASAQAVEALDLLAGQMLDADKSVVRSADADQLVQLRLQCRAVAVLRVLNNEHHQKRNDRGTGVDDQLPSVRIAEIRSRYTPNEHDEGCKDKSARTPCLSRDVGGGACEKSSHAVSSSWKAAHQKLRRCELDADGFGKGFMVDDLVTLAGGFCQTRPVEDDNLAAPIADDPGLLKRPGEQRDGGSA
jgi:hypothetical protein